MTLYHCLVRAVVSVRLQILLLGMCRVCASWSVAGHNHRKVIEQDPICADCTAWALVCHETVEQRSCDVINASVILAEHINSLRSAERLGLVGKVTFRVTVNDSVWPVCYRAGVADELITHTPHDVDVEDFCERRPMPLCQHHILVVSGGLLR